MGRLGGAKPYKNNDNRGENNVRQGSAVGVDGAHRRRRADVDELSRQRAVAVFRGVAAGIPCLSDSQVRAIPHACAHEGAFDNSVAPFHHRRHGAGVLFYNPPDDRAV